MTLASIYIELCSSVVGLCCDLTQRRVQQSGERCVSLGACVMGCSVREFAIIHEIVGASMNSWALDALFVAVLEGDRDRSRAGKG